MGRGEKLAEASKGEEATDDAAGSGGNDGNKVGSSVDNADNSMPATLVGAPRLWDNHHWQRASHALDSHNAKRRRCCSTTPRSSALDFDDVCSDDAVLAAMCLPVARCYDEACSDEQALAAMPLP